MFARDFPIFLKNKGLIYFDTAVTAQKPACVIEGIKAFYESENASVHRGIYELSRKASFAYHAVRVQVQRFLNAEHSEEIIFTRGTTSALNLVASSFGKAFIQKGDVIVLTEIEHHANLVPWQIVAEERGAILKFIPVDDDGKLILEEAQKIIQKGVKIVSLAHVSNVIGVKHPIKKIVEMARKAGAKVCLDGAQSAGHMPIDVRELDVDFFAFSGHKAYGPTGVGVLYGKKGLLEKMPPIEGGGDMIEKVTLAKTTFAPLPQKFEAGTPMIASVVGLGKALGYLSAIGLEKIERVERELVTYAEKQLEKVPGLKFIGKSHERGAILSFVITGVHPLDLATLLDCKKIAIRTGNHCSQVAMERFKVTSTCRISFGLYNTKEEIDIFVRELTNILQMR